MSIRRSSGNRKTRKPKNYSTPRLVKDLPQMELRKKVIHEMKKHATYDSFINNPSVQRLAFGFENKSTLQLPVDKLYILYQDNLKDIELLPLDVVLDDTPPVHVTFMNDRYILTEGYRRYMTAKETNQPLKAIVTINESVENKLTRELRTDIEELYNDNKN